MTLQGVVSASIESNDADHIWLRVTRVDGEALLLQANASGIGFYKWDRSTWSPIWVK